MALKIWLKKKKIVKEKQNKKTKKTSTAALCCFPLLSLPIYHKEVIMGWDEPMNLNEDDLCLARVILGIAFELSV